MNINTGSGTSNDPYIIKKPEDFLDMYQIYLDQSNAYYELGNDIDFDVEPYNSGSGWDPVNPGYVHFYLDGKGYKIKNLYINRPEERHLGLFSSRLSAYIKNIVFENVYVSGDRQVSVIAHTLDNGKIENCCIKSGEIHGGDYVSPFVYYNNATIKNCYSDIDIYTSGDSAAGIASQNRNKILNCYSLSRIHSERYSFDSPLKHGNGGLVADDYANTINSYWDIEKSKIEVNKGRGKGLTTAEMKDQKNFFNWDTEVWKFVDGFYPRLFFEPEPIINEFLFKDKEGRKTFDLNIKKWISYNGKNTDKKIKNLDNLIQNTTKSKKITESTSLNTGKQFNKSLNLKSFKTISNISIF